MKGGGPAYGTEEKNTAVREIVDVIWPFLIVMATGCLAAYRKNWPEDRDLGGICADRTVSGQKVQV